jgi:hypothetical protein
VKTYSGPKSLGGWCLIALAVAWSAALIHLAYVLPVESSMSIYVRSNGMYDHPKLPLVRINGTHVLYLVAVPLVVSVLVGLFSLLRLQLGWRFAEWAAWALSGLVVIAGVFGAVTILVGVFVLPTGALLIGACAAFRASYFSPMLRDPPWPRPSWEESTSPGNSSLRN